VENKLNNKLLLFILFIIFTSNTFCHEDSTEHLELPPDAGSIPTFQLIQQMIFTPKCTGCHSAGTSFAKQSGLVLTEDTAYEQLLNRKPSNRAAANDGLLLVGDKGFISLQNSLLWEKINAEEQEHFHTDHLQYGSLMPLGNFPLTKGEIELIRLWILAGAPKNSIVADPIVLEDTSKFDPPEFKALEKPEFGFQINTGPFRVPANRDREIFMFAGLNNPEPVYVNRIRITLAPGSHHILIWTNAGRTDNPPEGLIRDLYASVDGAPLDRNVSMADRQMFAGSQIPNYDYQFPPGMALKLPPNSGFDINSHYAQSSDEKTGNAYINL